MDIGGALCDKGYHGCVHLYYENKKLTQGRKQNRKEKKVDTKECPHIYMPYYYY